MILVRAAVAESTRNAAARIYQHRAADTNFPAVLLPSRTRLLLKNLHDAYKYGTLIHINYMSSEGVTMRTTLNIEDNLIDGASKLTGIKEKTKLVKLGLEALIARESSKRLARLGGTESQLKPIRRRKN
jgi:hypothetical protein